MTAQASAPTLANRFDLIAEMAAISARIDNLGPALNGVGPAADNSVLHDFETRVCTFAMPIGRLALMSVPVLFTPAHRRK